MRTKSVKGVVCFGLCRQDYMHFKALYSSYGQHENLGLVGTGFIT